MFSASCSGHRTWIAGPGSGVAATLIHRPHHSPSQQSKCVLGQFCAFSDKCTVMRQAPVAAHPPVAGDHLACFTTATKTVDSGQWTVEQALLEQCLSILQASRKYQFIGKFDMCLECVHGVALSLCRRAPHPHPLALALALARPGRRPGRRPVRLAGQDSPPQRAGRAGRAGVHRQSLRSSSAAQPPPR